MKTIGLIGGMSWESSAEYYRIINQEIKARLGGFHSAKCILYSVDFNDVEVYQRKEQWEKAAEILIEAAKGLSQAGADFIVICTNTMHKVADKITESINIPLLHIADIAAQEVLSKGIKTVGLLGTKYTMEQDFYRSRIETNGIKVLIPNEEDRDIVNRVIYHELCLGQILDESRNEYKRIIDYLLRLGADGIILGCTEIGMLIKDKDSDLPLFDTTLIHAKGAVDYALK